VLDMGNGAQGRGLDGSWVTVDEFSPEFAHLSVAGGLIAERTEILWCLLEEALETADGRAVVVDLTAVTVFDEGTVQALAAFMGAAARRRDEVRLATQSRSPLQQYLSALGVRSDTHVPAGARAA
jgi:anti-anti-sigma regulatory factor